MQSTGAPAARGAHIVRVSYAADTAITDISRVEPVLPTQEQKDQPASRPPETRRGDPEAALAAAEVKIDRTYVIPRENHNPIEMHATLAARDGDRLTLLDKISRFRIALYRRYPRLSSHDLRA